MASFYYEALDPNGQLHRGTVEADSAADAIVRLAQQALDVQSIHVASESSPPESVTEVVDASMRDRAAPFDNPPRLGSMSESAKSASKIYLQRIDAVLSRRDELLPVLQAFAHEKASAAFTTQLQYLIRRIDQGLTAEQLVHEPKMAIWLPIVMSGPGSSHMGHNYEHWIRQVTHEQNRRRSLWSMLSYPVLMLFFGLTLLVPISLWIVPTFQKMFSEFGLTLPPPTKLLFTLSDVINHQPGYLLVVSLALIAVGYLLISWWIRQGLTTRMFGMVVAGNSCNLLAISRLANVMAELLAVGAPLPEALSLAGKACRHEHFRRMANRLAEHHAVVGSKWRTSGVAHNFPSSLLNAFEAGPDSTPSIPLLRELATMYSQRAYERVHKQTGMGSPLLIAFVGLLIAMVIISLFMPLVSMVTSLT